MYILYHTTQLDRLISETLGSLLGTFRVREVGALWCITLPMTITVECTITVLGQTARLACFTMHV